LRAPTESGGLLAALYQFRRLLTLGEKGFEGRFAYAGIEPFYPMPASGTLPSSLGDLRVDTEVLATEHAGIATKWHFSGQNQQMLGFEVWPIQDEDPCEVYLSDYRKTSSGSLPFRIEVRFGNEPYGILQIHSYDLLKTMTASGKERS